jgi:hypothetical protein
VDLEVQRTYWAAFDSRRQELYRLDRVLTQLARPVRPGVDIPDALWVELRVLGLPVERITRREPLIQRVWGRKRPLMRELVCDDDPMPPCA